jgi:gas vesicle protein
MTNKQDDTKFGLGMVIGLVAGAVAGALLSPKSGKENREMVGNKMNDLKKALDDGHLNEKVQEMFGEVTNSTREMYIMITDELTQGLADLKGAVSEIDKDKYMTVVGKVVEKVKDKHEMPKAELDKIQKLLQKDYQRIVDFNKKEEKKPKKALPASTKTKK